MKLTEQDTRGIVLTPRALPKRSPGVHVSDIIRDLENTVTKPGERKDFKDLSPDEKRRMGNYVAVGWAWEEIFKRQMLAMDASVWRDAARYQHKFELVKDAIIATPDYVDTKEDVLIEFKATWRSSGRDIQSDFWSWWVQIKAYCHMLGLDHARLIVFFVCGDYRESGPQIKMWDAKFTSVELEENWIMLHQHAKRRGWLK